MKYFKSDNGFSFISMLISLAIVGIIASYALVQYRSMGLYGGDETNPASFTRQLDENLAISSLKNLHLMEVNYHLRYKKYATFEELQKDGAIAAGYTAKLQEKGRPYLDYWDIQIQAKEESYLLLATPNADASEFEEVPIFGMNESGEIWKEEGFEDSVDVETEEDDESVPFPF